MADTDQIKRFASACLAENDAATAAFPCCEESRAWLDYDMPCDKAGLEAVFGQGRVSPLFYSGRKWSKVYVSAGLRVGAYHIGPWGEPGMKRVVLAHFGRWMEGEDAIRAMWRIFCHPANHVELYAFAKSHPEMRPSYPIAALGSSTRDSGRSCVAILDAHEGHLRLACEDLTMAWSKETRFMLVSD